jgi:hypothetical protein
MLVVYLYMGIDGWHFAFKIIHEWNDQGTPLQNTTETHNFSGIASRTENMTMVTVVTPQDRLSVSL